MTITSRSFALGAAILLALAGCKKEEQPPPPPPEVGVIDMQPQTVALERELSGRLAPYRTADVRARVAGVLLKRVYDEGTDVKEGQVLFLIDPAPLQASLSSSQAALASARASYQNAKVAADRARKLAPQKFVSQADLDNAEATERSAAAAVQQAEAALTNARINLGYASVTAPISGRAGKQQVTEGALVGQTESTLLTTVDQLDPLYVNFSLSVEEYQALRAAQGTGNVQLNTEQATVNVITSDGRPYGQVGTLDFSDVVVDPGLGDISLRATLPNPEMALLPGTFVTVKATMGQQSGVFLVPQDAIQRDTAGAYAMVVGKDGKVARKNVSAERAVQGKWIVTQGLAAGDRVVAIGLQKAREGTAVKVIPYEQARAQAAQAPAGPTPAPGEDAKAGDAPAGDGAAKSDDAAQPASGQAE